MSFFSQPFLCSTCANPTKSLHGICENCQRALWKSRALSKNVSFLFFYTKPVAKLLEVMRQENNRLACKYIVAQLRKSALWQDYLQRADILITAPNNRTWLNRKQPNALEIILQSTQTSQHAKFSGEVLWKKREHRQHGKSASARLDTPLYIDIYKNSIPLVQNKNILLLDDVYTTGTTLLQCELILYRAGVNSVRTFTIARAFPRADLPELD